MHALLEEPCPRGSGVRGATLACVVALALSMCARHSPSRSLRVAEPVNIAATDKIDMSFIPAQEFFPGDWIARHKRLAIRGDGQVEFYGLKPTPYRTRDVGEEKAWEYLRELADVGLLDVESDVEPLLPPDRYVFSGTVGGRKIDAQVSARSADKKLVQKFQVLHRALSRDEK